LIAKSITTKVMQLSCFEMIVFLKSENSERKMIKVSFELAGEVYSLKKIVCSEFYYE